MNDVDLTKNPLAAITLSLSNCDAHIVDERLASEEFHIIILVLLQLVQYDYQLPVKLAFYLGHWP